MALFKYDYNMLTIYVIIPGNIDKIFVRIVCNFVTNGSLE